MRDSVATVRAPGLSTPLRLRPFASDFTVFHQIFVEQELQLPWKTEVRTVLDGGANVGYASAFLHHSYPQASILAIEPDPANAAEARINLATMPDVTLTEAAIWGETRQLRIRNPEAAQHAFQVGPSDDGTIAGRTVAELMNEQGWDHLDLCKLDIEGAEMDVFLGDTSFLTRTGILLVETHDRLRPGCSAAVEQAVAPHVKDRERVGEYDMFVLNPRVPCVRA